MARTAYPAVGRYRQIRLKPEPNAAGNYELLYYLAGVGTKRESTKAKTWAEAQAYRDQFIADAKAELAAVGPAAQTRFTVDSLCDRWVTWAKQQGKHRKNFAHLLPVRAVLGGYYWDNLTTNPALLDDYMTDRPVKPATVARELAQLRAVLNWAVEKRLIAGELPRFKLPAAGGVPRDKFLDWDHERWFWDQAMLLAQRNRWNEGARNLMVFIAIAMETAARREAIVELTWDRVNFMLGLIDFQVPGVPATKKRRHDALPISKRLWPVLEEARRRAPKDGSGRATGRVITITADTISKTFRRHVTRLGVPWVSPHILRHTWASLAAMSGMSMMEISKVLCDTIAMVEKHYAKLSPQHLRNAIDFKERAPQGQGAPSNVVL